MTRPPRAVGSRAAATLAFTAVVLRSLSRDRVALFFLLVLPVAIITVIGAAFGGADSLTVAVVRQSTGPPSDMLLASLREADGINVRDSDDLDGARDDMRRGRVGAVVVVPSGFDESILEGRSAEVELQANFTSAAGPTALTTVTGVVERVAWQFTAAQVTASRAGGSVAAALPAAERVAAPVAVTSSDVDGGDGSGSPGRFAIIAPQNLVLFVFINSLASAALIVVARRNGVLRRAVATRSGLPAVVVGLGLGWFALALVQSALVLGFGGVLFGVDWGDPLAAGLLVVVFAAVGSGGGLLVGALGRDPDRVSSITPILGIVLGALGGCMVPLEFFPPVMETIAHAVPQYWAVTGWQRLVFDDAGVAEIAGPLLVLAGFATVLVSLAGFALRRDLLRG